MAAELGEATFENRELYDRQITLPGSIQLAGEIAVIAPSLVAGIFGRRP